MAFTRVCCRPFAIYIYTTYINGLGAIAPACKACKKVASVCTSGRPVDRSISSPRRSLYDSYVPGPRRTRSGNRRLGIDNNIRTSIHNLYRSVVVGDVQVRRFHIDMKNIYAAAIIILCRPRWVGYTLRYMTHISLCMGIASYDIEEQKKINVRS